MIICFSIFGKLFGIILLKILHTALGYNSSPQSLSSFIFLSQFFILLSKNSSTYSLIYVLSLSPEVLSSTLSSMLEWFSTLLFILCKKIYISGISVWFSFSEVFHIFVRLLFHVCAIFFISYISFFIISLVWFWSLLKFILNSFSFFCVFSIFYLCCLWYSLSCICFSSLNFSWSFSISISMSSFLRSFWVTFCSLH
jgi:hypothetical protein